MKSLLPFNGKVVLLALLSFAFLQQMKAQAPEVQQAEYFDISAPLRDMTVKKPAFWKKWTTEVEREIPNKFHIKPVIHPDYMNQSDGALQKSLKKEALGSLITPLVNFDGLTNAKNTDGRVTPPDPAGDVGPNHYVQAVNSMLQIFNKTGVSLYGPVTTSVLWNGFTGNWSGHNDGDALVMYDELADRWIISQFAVDCGTFPNYTEYELVAVSQTSDPTGAYYRYAFKFDYMPDYPKLGVWHDGYYISVNRFNTNNSASPFIGAAMGVLERAKMLAGDPTAKMIYYKSETLGGSGSGLGSDCYSMLPGDCDGTAAPAGTPNYFSYINDDSWGGKDELRIWSLKPDWTTTTNSVCKYESALPVAAFATFSSYVISQKDVTLKLDDLSDRLMHRLQYRNMGSYESMVTCHSVNSGSNIAGVRWYELRKSGTSWSIYQQGTYAFADGKSRWMGSAAMNGNGDIALGYTLSGSSDYPSIYFTGRKATDAPGTMTIAESPIKIGSASMTGADRWGDYAMMSVDPVDNKTFWHTNEYVGTYGGSYPWSTRIASFVFANTPLIATLAATSVTGISATLNGTVNPNGFATDYYFAWGTTTSYGNVTSTVSAGSGATDIPVNAGIAGLIPGTTYHYRIVASNSEGTSNGSDITFIGGQATVTTSAVTAITATTATGGGNLTTEGSSTSTRGICWSTTANPTIADAHTTDGTGLGVYTSSITGLIPGTLYHVRAYASNTAGTVYGTDISFTSGALNAPVATAGSVISSSSFTANWNTTDGANSYNLDVSLFPSFTVTGGSSTQTEGFDGGITAPAGWTFTNIGATYTTIGNYGAASPSLKLDATGDAVETSLLETAASQLSFWCKGQSTNTESALLIEGYNGSSWVTLDNFKPLPVAATTKTYNSSSSPALPANFVKFRFSYSKSTGNLALDDVSITAGGSVASFVPGYESLSVTGATSQSVTSLTANTPYYYRVRAKNGAISSTNSNVITVKTTDGGTSPTLFVTPATLSAFTYLPGNGPSTSQSYNLSGSNLTGAPGTITVNGSSSYEVSLDNSVFSGNVSVPYTTATLATTPIFVRLKAGLGDGYYNSEIIANTGGGATSANVDCSGSVTMLLTPVVTVGTISDFGEQPVNTYSVEKSYTVSGANLTSNIEIVPPAGIEISTTSGSGFVVNPNKLTLIPTGGVIPATTIYVRFAPVAGQSYNGNITHTSAGTDVQNVAVNGTGVVLSAPQVVISQVYGGGGNTGAIFTNDFIELFNRGTSSVNLNGWSVQYASATGTSWSNLTALTNVTIAPGQYYLIKEASGGAVGAALPTADVSGGINMSGTAGKIALVNNITPLTGACPTGTNIIDFVGYGLTANCFEGTGPTPAPSNTTAVIRISNGCTDNNQNATDFVSGTPAPRNTASPLNICSVPSPILTATPATLSNFNYIAGSGPSAAQSYNLGGSNLTGAPGVITVSGNTNYEVSKDNSTFSSTVSIPFTTSTLASTPVYVRLKAGLSIGLYNNELLANAGGGAAPVNTSCSGAVMASLAAPLAIAASNVTSNSFAANWNASSGATGYILDVATDNAFASIIAGYTNLSVSNLLTYSVTGLTDNLPYYYRVKASLGGAVSDNSNTIMVSTLPLNTGFNFDESAQSDAYSFQKTVFVNIKDNAKGEILIYTVGGKLVFSTPAVQGISRFYLKMPGVYIIKVHTSTVNMAKKVVIK